MPSRLSWATDGPPADREDDPEQPDRRGLRLLLQSDQGVGGRGRRTSERLERLELLRITLCDLLKVVSITLEADDNAQVIFETLNARGTPLLALDLVKNAVFLEAAEQGLETDALYEEIWKPEFDAPTTMSIGAHERRQGRLNRPIGELFLMHWLTMKLRRVVPATELFATFREQILVERAAAADGRAHPGALPRRADDAELRRPRAGSVEATFFERLERSTRRRCSRSSCSSSASRRSARSAGGGRSG